MYKFTGILWSGGLDSTYAIWTYLTQNPEDTVVAYYVEIENNVDKSKMEKAAISMLTGALKKLFPNRFEYRGVLCSANVIMVGDNLSFKQLPIWLMAMMYMPKDVAKVMMGYVMNDDAVSYLEDIKATWKWMQEFRDKPAELIFPVTKWKKESIWEYLPKELKDHVVSCETPRSTLHGWEPCGHCNSCHRDPKYGELQKSVKMVEPGPKAVCEKLADPVCGPNEMERLRAKFCAPEL